MTLPKRMSAALRGACAVAAAVLLVQATHADITDAKVMRIVVPYPAGGVTDAVARAVATQVGESTGRKVFVDNRPGAGSVLGMQQCARAEPDGATLCITNPDSLSYAPQLFTALPYDVDKDFAPVIKLGTANTLLITRSDAPFASFDAMIAYAKAHPGKLNWGTWGAATLPDIYLRWIGHKMDVDIVAIHYKGGSGTIPAIVSGEVDVTYAGFGTALPLIGAGKVKALVATGATPLPILRRLNAEFAEAVASPKVQAVFKSLSIDPVSSTVEAFTAFARADRENAARVFKSAGIEPAATP
jgi:tripartite-type tricarboxylate transporter receptor subunit TctC